jgi:aspartate carbamoyltransferase catalytic subunit
MKHIINAQQFNRKSLERIFKLTDEFKNFFLQGKNTNIFRNKILATLFYEPSTRTRLSFESAMIHLGGRVISTENARQFSSASKGETLEDTIKIINSYADVIVLRHHESGSAQKAASVSKVPIINAGDGSGQHPTQALLDLYTIKDELGRIDGISIAMVGDLANGRTVRSLCYLLGKYEDIKIYFVSPKIIKMKDDIKQYLDKHNICFYEEDDLKSIANKVDVIYQTRIQKERFGDRLDDYKKACGVYVINNEIINIMKDKAIVMHPLPRVNEILPEVDESPKAAYFRQAENGLYVRIALLRMVLS